MTTDRRASGPRLPACSASGLAPILLLVVALGACAPAATTGPTTLPSTGPSQVPTASPQPTVGAISHATGSSDVVLRFEEGGGFVPVDFLVTQAPSFTLYGDGIAIFRDSAMPAPTPVGLVNPSLPFEAVRLSEEQVQSILGFAIGEGGLGLAIGPYLGPGADLPTATFTIKAGGLDKSVSVTGLGLDFQGPERQVVGALRNLAARLAGFGSTVSNETPWTPERYRGVLIAQDMPQGQPIDWPWPAIKVSDFVQGDGPFPTRTMTAADIAALKVDALAGGFQGLLVKDPAGKVYGFAARPLLPDEAK